MKTLLKQTLTALAMGGALGVGLAQAQLGHWGEEALGPTEVEMQAQGTGVVLGVDDDNRHIYLTHEPIPQMTWPAQENHRLAVADPALLRGLRHGQRVRFTVDHLGIITAIEVLR